MTTDTTRVRPTPTGCRRWSPARRTTAGSDGRIGRYDSPYVGATQMLAAVAKPPHLAAIAPAVTAFEYYEGWTYQGGAFAY